MAEIVPVRELKVYQTDDGRRVEVFSSCGSVDAMQNTEKASREFSKQDNIYIGVVHIMTEDGPKEIKFEISDISTIEEAFGKYHEMAGKSIKEMEERWNEQQKEEENQIITAPADALRSIDESQEGGQIII